MINNLTKYLTLILLLSCLSCSREKITFETRYLKLGINGKGFITSFYDRLRSFEYFPKGGSSPLLTLYQVKLTRGFENKFRDVQTGEPVSSKFILNNPFGEQPLKFYISASASENDLPSAVSNIQLKINNYQTMQLTTALKAGDRIICDGKEVYLCDEYWKKIRAIYEGKIPVIERGNYEIVINSEFSSASSPKLQLEFKSVGEPEKIRNMN